MEFERRFRSEKACRDYLAKIRWGHGFTCPRCTHMQGWQTARNHWRCGKCQVDSSPTSGTIFHGSHLSLRIWFRAIWWVTNQKSGASALGLQQMLGLGSYRTAWTCLHKLRRAMVRPGRDSLSGKVEVDEIPLGGIEKENSGHAWRDGRGKAIVAIAVERYGERIARIRLKRIAGTTIAHLSSFVKAAVMPGSEVITDGWHGYNGLKEIGYIHQPMTLRGMGQQASKALLPGVNRVASLLKRWLLGIHQGRVSKKYLGYYLDEFTFRFNRRTSSSRGMLFYRLIEQAVLIDHVPYRNLVNSNSVEQSA
jgi:transposase-like protein